MSRHWHPDVDASGDELRQCMRCTEREALVERLRAALATAANAWHGLQVAPHARPFMTCRSPICSEARTALRVAEFMRELSEDRP